MSRAGFGLRLSDDAARAGRHLHSSSRPIGAADKKHVLLMNTMKARAGGLDWPEHALDDHIAYMFAQMLAKQCAPDQLRRFIGWGTGPFAR
jgi:hypothetical protein